MAGYIPHDDVPKKHRLTKGQKYAFFTNHNYSEVIIPQLKGQNIFTLKEYERKFAYGSGHVTSVLIQRCIDYDIHGEDVFGNSIAEGDQGVHYFYTSQGYMRLSSLTRGGIVFINGDYFDKAYFLAPNQTRWLEVMCYLTQMGNLLKPRSLKK